MSDPADRLPRVAHIYSITLAHFNSSFNPIFYAIFNPAFKRGYLIFLSKVLPELCIPKNRVYVNTSNRKDKTQNTTTKTYNA